MNTALISERCKSGVVYIETPVGSGTGFLVSEQGHIVTNYHVPGEYMYSCTIRFLDGKTFRGYSVIDKDKEHDLALLRISNLPKGKYTILSILDKGNAKDGTDAATIGHPKGSKWSINKGIVSKEILHEEYSHLAQIDVPVNPGNSGGPLFNKNGLVVGVVTARFEKRNIFERDVQNMNIAINANELRSFLRKNRVNFSNKIPIEDEELSTEIRTLSEEEKEAAKQANLEKIEAQKQLDQEILEKEKQQQEELLEEKTAAEKERIAKERELERLRLENQKWLDQLNAKQRAELQEQEFEQKAAIKAAESDLEIQRIKEKKEREWLNLENDKLNLEKEKLRLHQKRKNYFANLPGRFSIRVGGGVAYMLGAVEEFSSLSWQPSALSWQAQGSLLYRFDIKNQLRGTSVGLFGQLGSFGGGAMAQLQQQQNLSGLDDNRVTNLYYAWEAGFLVREWLRLSAGLGRQEFHQVNDKTGSMYGSATLGFTLRIKMVELVWDNNLRFGGLYRQPALSTSLGLVVHFKVAKF